MRSQSQVSNELTRQQVSIEPTPAGSKSPSCGKKGSLFLLSSSILIWISLNGRIFDGFLSIRVDRFFAPTSFFGYLCRQHQQQQQHQHQQQQQQKNQVEWNPLLRKRAKTKNDNFFIYQLFRALYFLFGHKSLGRRLFLLWTHWSKNRFQLKSYFGIQVQE